MEAMQFIIGLTAGGALAYVWARLESKWGWTFAIVAVALTLSGGMTPLEFQGVDRLCPQATETCDAAKSVAMVVLFASGATFLGGLVGGIGGAWVFDEERHRVNA